MTQWYCPLSDLVLLCCCVAMYATRLSVSIHCTQQLLNVTQLLASHLMHTHTGVQCVWCWGKHGGSLPGERQGLHYCVFCAQQQNWKRETETAPLPAQLHPHFFSLTLQVGTLLHDWRRINVALTRARHKLVLVGSETTLRHIPLLAALLQLLRERAWIVELPPLPHSMSPQW